MDITEFVHARLAEERDRVLAAALRAVVEDMSFYWRKYPEGLAAKELADRTLRALAGIWANHPDYDPAWGPCGPQPRRYESGPGPAPRTGTGA